MKKSFLYMLILAVVLVLPTRSTDVGKLRPVQTVAAYKNGTEYVIETDTEDVGRGESVEAAVKDLKETTPATIYLDTAQYLIVGEEELAEEMRPYLKDSVRLCRFMGDPPMDSVSRYLVAHGGNVTLENWKIGDRLPMLDCTKERLKIF